MRLLVGGCLLLALVGCAAEANPSQHQSIRFSTDGQLRPARAAFTPAVNRAAIAAMRAAPADYPGVRYAILMATRGYDANQGDHGWIALARTHAGLIELTAGYDCYPDDTYDFSLLYAPGDLVRYSTKGGDNEVCPPEIVLVRKDLLGPSR